MGVLAQTAPVPSGRAYPCKINTLCEDDEDRAKVAEWMADKSRSTRSVAIQIGVSEGTAAKHRYGACSCARRG